MTGKKDYPILLLLREHMKASDVRDELKHIRLIHFTLTTVSGVMLYLIILAWSVPPQIYGELADLRDFLERFQAGRVPLREVHSREAIQVEDQILQRLQTLIHPGLQWGAQYEPPLACAPKAKKDDLSKETLSEVVDRAAKETCQLVMPEQIELNAGEAQAWIKDMTRLDRPFVINTGPYITDFKVGVDAHLGAGNRGRATLRINSAPPGGQDGITIVRHHDKEVTLTITLSARSYDLPSDWLQQRFPDVVAYRNAIGNKSLDDALAWAREQRTTGISSFKPNLLGVEVKSTDVGGVGPLVIAAMLLYMLAYLQHWVTIIPEEAGTVQESVRSVSPWLGTQNALGFLITAATVACAPAVVTVLSLYRLLGWPLSLSVLLGLVTFLIGALCVRNAYQLARRKVEIA